MKVTNVVCAAKMNSQVIIDQTSFLLHVNISCSIYYLSLRKSQYSHNCKLFREHKCTFRRSWGAKGVSPFNNEYNYMTLILTLDEKVSAYSCVTRKIMRVCCSERLEIIKNNNKMFRLYPESHRSNYASVNER